MSSDKPNAKPQPPPPSAPAAPTSDAPTSSAGSVGETDPLPHAQPAGGPTENPSGPASSAMQGVVEAGVGTTTPTVASAGPTGPTQGDQEPSSPASAGGTSFPQLLTHHLEMLRNSAISPAVIAERGYRSVTVKAELARLGFSRTQTITPALLLPICGPSGATVNYQARPDQPRIVDGKAVKYETPAKSRMVIDIPPRARQALRDPAKPLFITEGIKKADSAVSKGLCCIGLLGVWNWRGTNELGGKTTLVEFEMIALEGRQIYIVFDSDVVTKPAVHSALVRLKAFLEHRKATVAVVYLPSGPDGSKVGLDDFFAGGKTVDDVLIHARPDVRPTEDSESVPAIPYTFEPDGIYLLRATKMGVVRIRLTNFTARIVREVTIDDGFEPRKSFQMQADLEGRVSEFEVAADEFDLMRWPSGRIGAGAALLPTHQVERHVRAAIHMMTGVAAPRGVVYVHAGWRKVGGENVFLHAGGAIGPRGNVDEVEVRFDGPIAGIRLPPPAEADALRSCARAVLELMEIGPSKIMFPLLAAVARVVIDECDFSIHLAGGTGVFKTAIAALFQQFFGATMDARHLVGSWASTGNSLEALAFHAKDVLLVVDDFAPTGGVSGNVSIHQKADRVLRGQGNRSGRGRCGPDGSLLPVKGPRGLILSTGEEVPRGASLRARMLLLQVQPGDVDVERLTRVQAYAQRGDFAQFLANFLQWLSPNLENVRKRLPGRLDVMRQEFAKSGRHRRVPGIAADLLFGIEVLVEFLQVFGVMNPSEASLLLGRASEGLRETIEVQRLEQEQAEPALQFVRLLRSALVSGDAHLRSVVGGRPPNPIAFGWRRANPDFMGGDNWLPGGRCVGWVDATDVYLDTELALRAAQAIGSATGDPISVLAPTLAKRLKEAGKLKSIDPDGRHIEVRRRIEGVRMRVLHFAVETIFDCDTLSMDRGAADPDGGHVGEGGDSRPDGLSGDARSSSDGPW